MGPWAEDVERALRLIQGFDLTGVAAAIFRVSAAAAQTSASKARPRAIVTHLSSSRTISYRKSLSHQIDDLKERVIRHRSEAGQRYNPTQLGVPDTS